MTTKEMWVGLCPKEEEPELRKALFSLDSNACLELAPNADELRAQLLASAPGEKNAIVGFVKAGVSDINLCASLVADGHARNVALVRRRASGSLRSRAQRAGISYVIDPDNTEEVLRTHPITSLGVAAPSANVPAESRDLVLRSSSNGAGLVPPVARHLSSEHPPLICISSVRGGAGKTTLSAMMGALCASWGMRVGLLDLDLAYGNLARAFGKRIAPDLSQAFGPDGFSTQALKRIRLAINDQLHLFGPCKNPEYAELVSEHLNEFIASIADAYDILLCDVSAAALDTFAQAVQAADRFFVVSESKAEHLPELSKIGGLAVRLGVARTRIVRIENHADERLKEDLSFARAEKGFEQARSFRVFEAAPSQIELVRRGEVLDLSQMPCPFSNSVAHCLAQELQELGCLPLHEKAQKALQETQRRRSWWPFVQADEVVSA